MKILMILILLTNNVLAIDITPIREGEKATKDGFFIDPPNMKKLRKNNEERKLLKKENIELKELGLVQEEKGKLLKNQWEETSKALTKAQIQGTTRGIGGFLLGVVATSLAAFAAAKAIK